MQREAQNVAKRQTTQSIQREQSEQKRLMKKILSTLVMCLILGVGSVWAQDCFNTLPTNTSTKDVGYIDQKPTDLVNYGLVVQLAIEGRGKAAVGYQSAYDQKYSWSDWTFDETKVSWIEKSSNAAAVINCYDYEAGYYTSTRNNKYKYIHTYYSYAKQNFYFYAQETQPGYYFSNWEWDSSSLIDNHAQKNSDTSEGHGNNGHITQFSMIQPHSNDYYTASNYPCNIPIMKAVFAPVTVNSATDGVVEVNDINSTVTGTVSFSVSGADDINDFETPIVTGTDFRYVSMSYNNNVVTVTVQYTSQTTDNVNGDPKPEFSANVTLTSKGGEVGVANKTQTATIKANVSLVPTFTINPTSYDFFNEYGIIANSESKTKTLAVTTTNNAATASAWSFTLSDAVADNATTFTGSDNPYSIDFTNPLQPVVKFTAPANGFYENLTCTLSINCTYTDAQTKQIVSDTKQVVLTADAGSAIKINNTQNASHDFGTTIYGTGASTSLPFTATVAYTEDWNATSPFTYTVNANTIDVNVPADAVPGDYSSTLNFTYDGDVVATLAVSAQVRLAKPVLTATGGLGNAIQLDWTAVHGATKYIVKSGATEVVVIGDDEPITNTYKVTAIGANPIKLGQEYAFTVTAIYDTANPYGEIVSDEVRVAASVHSTITSSTGLDIYTGTEKVGSYPYYSKGKVKVDLSAAFNNGVAAFDKLYIFGLTTGDANDNITIPTSAPKANSNAVTPCYIYSKSGNDYVLSQTIENVNVATKPSSFNITASGQKIYFTGYAPYASCGSTWEENGVFFIDGKNNIDIYLNDLELYARPKTELGDYPALKTFEVNKDNVMSYLDMDEFKLDIKWEGLFDIKFNGLNVYSQGSGSAFCFYPNTNNLDAKIHLLGENVLQSARGMDIHVDVSIGMTLNAEADQHSAPIQIIHNKESVEDDNKTTLTIDDKWISDNRTNGKLNLATVAYRAAPTIDLGTEKTTLVINGGQLFLANSFNTSTTYDVSYAISYRYYSIKDGLAKMYGLGSDQPGATVLFKDGTINCRSLPPSITQSTSPVVQGIYKKLFHNPTSMKCPANTKIDGGTFNCDVLACNSSTSKGGSPTNSNGSPLCMVDIPVKTQLANGLVETLIDDWMNYAAQLPDGANTNDLSYYGIESMNPEQITDVNGDPSTVVHMMLPSDKICFKEEITTSWVMCYPRLDIITNAGVQATNELGGNKRVPFSIETDDDTKLVTIKKTSKLLFASMDEITINSVGSYQAPGNSTVVLKEGGLPANILNENNYVIYDKVYMLMPVVANDWKLFSPPFDVSNVYIIESYPEQKLIEAFSNGAKDKKGNPIITGEKIAEARIAQAHRMIDLLYQWIWENDVTPGKADVWSNDPNYKPMGSIYSVGSFVQFWYNMYAASERPVIEQLYHYKSSNEGYPTGKSRWDANFYLYEVKGESWGIDDNGLQTSWKEVPTISVPRDIKGTNKVIMQKGHVYSMSFPYTIVNSEVHDPSTVWDYWTGKYILLEGYPAAENNIDSDGDGKLDSKGQIIAGTDSWNEITEEFTVEGKAVVRGNYTFYSDEVTSDNIFVVNGKNENEYKDGYDHNVFVNYDNTWLYPADCFVYANAPASPSGMPRRISSINPISGEITYRDETTTSLPTIGGNKQMMVYNIEGGVGIVPVVAQQVSIYNAAGQLVTSEYLTDEVHISLPTGIYLIAGAQDQFKAVVK